MKKLIIIISVIGLFILAWFVPSVAESCTGIRLEAKDGTVVHARTLEFIQELGSNIIVIPRGTELGGSLPESKHDMKWKAKYAAVGTDAMGEHVLVDGVNEKGLSLGIFFYNGYAQYPPFDESKASRTIQPVEFGIWVLTNFATIEEVKAALPGINVVEPKRLTAVGPQTYHFLIVDDRGRSIVIEPNGGHLQVFDNPLGVLTNPPEFDWHMTNLNSYIKLTPVNASSHKIGDVLLKAFGEGSGLLGIPGDSTPPSRFVRATFFSTAAEPVKTGKDVVLQAFHILNNFDIAKGSVRTGNSATKGLDYTQWTSVADLKNRRFYIRTYDDMTVKMVDLARFDLDAPGIKTVNLQGVTPIMNVSGSAQ